MILISVAAPQHLQYHQKGERERQKQGEKLVILISVAAPQHLQYHQKGERERRARSKSGKQSIGQGRSFCLLKCLGLFS